MLDTLERMLDFWKDEVSLTRCLSRHLVSRRLTPEEAAACRHRISGLIVKAADHEKCLDMLLNICVIEGGVHGLDAAIDVLAAISGILLLGYAWSRLRRDGQMDKDVWYILLRAVSKADVPDREKVLFVYGGLKDDTRGVREGVVAAMRRIGTAQARYCVERIAEDDSDSLIRKIAREALADWNE